MIAYSLQALYEKCSTQIDLHSPCAIARHAVRRCRSVRDIDSVITAQVYGIDVDEYYDNQSCLQAMPHVAVPMLCLNARDDPLIDPAMGDTAARIARKNSNVVSVLTSHGGHLGWVDGWRHQWMCPAVADYLCAVHAVLEEEAAMGFGGGGKGALGTGASSESGRIGAENSGVLDSISSAADCSDGAPSVAVACAGA